MRPAVALSLAGLGLEGTVAVLSRRLGGSARTVEQLLEVLDERPGPRLLVLWDLDRAEEPARIVTSLLGVLSSVRGLRVAAEAAVVERVGCCGAGAVAPAVLDLDDPRWTDAARFERWYRKLAGDQAFGADRVYPNPGLARLAALVPPEVDGRGGVAAAWWAALPGEVRAAVLALARAGVPLTRAQWSVLAGAAVVERAAALVPSLIPAGDSWFVPAAWVGEGSGVRDEDRAAVPAPGEVVTRTLLADSGDGALPQADEAGLLGLLVTDVVRSGADAPWLADPAFVSRAGPRAVTAAFVARPSEPLATAWRRAAPALLDETRASVRAEVLRTHLLGPGHPVARPTSSTVGWQARWALWTLPERAQAVVAGELVVAALGRGPYAGWVVVADELGDVLLLDAVTGAQAPPRWPKVPKRLRSLVCRSDGTFAALDEAGAPRVLFGAEPEPWGGSAASALAWLPARGDGCGSVHWLPSGAGEVLHTGPVTALDGVPLPEHGPVGGEEAVLLVSGGADGLVRAWKPGHVPMPNPVDSHTCPVTAVAIAAGPRGLVVASAWADGLIRICCLAEPGRTVELRLGAAARDLLVDDAGHVLALLPDGLVSVAITP
ncbi:hypothetical protein P3T37_002692 [Kitasatospora sp. MAA4]|uniref:hypothetical protein n=1 Tax=Kitasatospora sp. MAA4 TaxID=3035093 RepID=UPI002475BD50|nr:hypothetical protein [Kitasatospora sp. MAA4]MDH6133297.1 hypothetical protein [Kitasatospora sp. MAA4]